MNQEDHEEEVAITLLQPRFQNISPGHLRSLYFCLMKFFLCLMSVYMLLLSCMPCNDSSDCSAGEQVSVLMTDTDHDHHEDEENCTPFCVCACCAASVFQPPIQIAIRNYATGKSINVYPEEDFFSASHGSIWQPPRLG